MVAFHFPPLAGSSGIQRTLRFAQHLPMLGWQPLVLTARTTAYERTSDDLSQEIPSGSIVRRALALDAARHLAIGGRYFGAMARPDRWASWKFDAVRVGMKMIKEFRPDVLWSTYPIATAHLIGAELQRRSGLPWVADFRDPMAQNGYPEDPLTWHAFKRIETLAISKAARCTFTTPSASKEYQQRYPEAAHRISLLENGYDEETFSRAEASADKTPLNPGAFTLLHSGIVYPSERDPTQLIQALALLHKAGRIHPDRLKLRFRAAVAEDMLHRLAIENGVSAYLQVLPAVPYQQALSEMLRADGLLILQARNCNAQIPAKLYEYLRARRPLVCLTDPEGDTAATLFAADIRTLAPLDDASKIADLLLSVVAPNLDPLLSMASQQAVEESSRKGRTAILAKLLDDLAHQGASK
ncbi:glycosyltransferase [Roseateles oligotrophus]|uniref:Glycosyltransferase n=1 Tax=Roseateles oligotrophus TaxID=1769250 RepID=A0ABT2YFB7_9BURK|nr:glycosyltransferase [Roseateles oligotrophus]MCV2368745.1 glycosyltransferase [Roseateles oligotrophus]